MNLEQRFFKQVQEVRAAQRRYFAQRTTEHLSESVQIEQRLDKSLEWIKRHAGEIKHPQVKNVQEMRKYQIAYWKGARLKADMQKAMRYEKKVDAFVADYFSNQKKLEL